MLQYFLIIFISSIVYVSGESIRIASFNLKNYCLAPRIIEGQYYTQYPKPYNEKKAILSILKKVQADILAIQEIGDLSFLKELQQDLKHIGINYPEAIVVNGPDTTRRIGILSKQPIFQVQFFEKIPFFYKNKEYSVFRGMLGVFFQNHTTQWGVYIVHLKSYYPKSDKDTQNIKRAEAQAVRECILKNNQGYPFLIVGDFNDHLYSQTLKVFLKKNKQTITQPIVLKDTHSQTWTFHNGKTDNYSRMDYILSTPSMLKYIDPPEGKIEDSLPYSLEASDHRLIYIDLKFP